MLDRALQRQILDLLRGHYPRGAFQSATLSLVTNKAPQTLQYLEEHGLCKSV